MRFLSKSFFSRRTACALWGLLVALGLSLAGSLPALAQSTNSDQSTTSEMQVLSRDTLKGYLIPITGNSGSVNLQVHFELASAKLSGQAVRQVEELAAALKSDELAEATITISGHTDASGDAAYNKTLSEQRAAAVMAQLVTVHGMAAERFTVEGHGEDRLLEGLPPNDAANRRVEVVTTLPASRSTEGQTEEGEGITAID